MDLIKKRTSEAFGKKVYLLGVFDNGEYFWLEEAKWDCGWYWGFGYIETYTNNKFPNRAADISSHSHWQGGIAGYVRDTVKPYINHMYDNNHIVKCTLTEQESWKLAELMKSYYTLKEAAALLDSGSAHVTENPAEATLHRPDMAKTINEELMPAIFAQVYELLDPESEYNKAKQQQEEHAVKA